MPVGAPKGDIGRSASNRQTAQHDFIEKLREDGLSKYDLPGPGIEGQAKARGHRWKRAIQRASHRTQS